MINTGYHEEKVWKSVLFQIMAGLHAMHINEITIKSMSLMDNIYIKDLMTNNQNGFWKYTIDNIEYFVPNYGFLVMIDSNYKNIANDTRTIKTVLGSQKLTIDDMEYKMYGRVDPNYDPSKDKPKLDKLQFDNLISILNSNNFGQQFRNDGGVTPHSILPLLDKINNLINMKKFKNGDLKSIFPETMTDFLNNRVGTILDKTEVEDGVNKVVPTEWIRGKMYVRKNGTSNIKYTFVILLEHNNINNTVKIVTRKGYTINDAIINLTVSDDEINEWVSLNPIKQQYITLKKKGLILLKVITCNFSIIYI